tara:strand:+ start:12119 stop:12340 length:222 start_codon:yes stop_codon:yes gene_type:complete
MFATPVAVQFKECVDVFRAIEYMDDATSFANTFVLTQLVVFWFFPFSFHLNELHVRVKARSDDNIVRHSAPTW